MINKLRFIRPIFFHRTLNKIVGITISQVPDCHKMIILSIKRLLFSLIYLQNDDDEIPSPN